MGLQLAPCERILFPFFAKPAPLLTLANGAISLLAILPVKLMTVLAVRLSRIDSWNRGAINQGVLCGGHEAKVLRVYARPVFTDVVHHHARGDFPVEVKPRHSVRTPILPAKEERPVSIPIKRAKPQETAIGLNGVFVGESQVFCIGESHVHLHCAAQGIMVLKVKSNGMV